jgi:hypothetical protein
MLSYIIGGRVGMRIRIIDCNTKETWLYNIRWDKVKENFTSYERLYIMDDELLDKTAINMAIHQFFGSDSIFYRDKNIRSYIFGKIKESEHHFRPVFIFFED